MIKVAETLERLAESFTVADIMVPRDRLVCARNWREAREMLQAYPDYDTIPITNAGVIAEFLDRETDEISSLSLQVTISDSTSILDLVDIVSKHKFSFVLGGRRLVGYVHFSDLNTHYAKLPYFVLFEAVETVLVESTKGQISIALLAEILDPKRLELLKKRMASQSAARSELGWENLLYFSEIMRAAVALDRCGIKPAEVDVLSSVRNRIAHVGDPLIKGHQDVQKLARTRELCTALLHRVPLSDGGSSFHSQRQLG